MKKQAGRWGGLALLAAAFATGAPAQDDGLEAAPADEPADVEGSSTANGNDRRYYLAPMASYTRADDDRTTDDGFGGVLSLGRKMTWGLNLELTVFYQRMDAAGGAAELSGFGLAGVFFPSTTHTRLYGILAVHQADTTAHPTTPASAGAGYDGTVFDSGIGYLLPLEGLTGVEMALRVEARYRMDSHHEPSAGVGGKDEFYEGVLNVGLLIPFGALPVDEAPAEPGVPVDPEEPVDATDGGSEPAASDCRAPGPGEQVDLAGCATGVAVVLEGVTFETGSSRLTAGAMVVLNGVADSLAAAPAVRVEIGGHTDAQGSDAFNLALSERRARAVRDYLAGRGLDASRLEARGYGESQPKAGNDTAAGRELNRRVEMKILEGAGP
jgi:OOP family OmpA-OmpF porin